MTEQHLCEHLQCIARLLHGRGHRCGLEIAATVNVAVLNIHKRIVASGVELDGKLALGEQEIFELGANPLGGGTKGVAILGQADDLADLFTGHAPCKLRPREEGADVGCGLHLAGMGAYL